MKKLLFISALVAIAANSEAQTFKVQQPERKIVISADTTVDAGTVRIAFNSIGSNLMSLQATVDKVNGTVAGKVYFEATTDGRAWVKLDSLTLSDQVQNTKVLPITATVYNSYRASHVGSGTQRSILSFSRLNRPDEHR